METPVDSVMETKPANQATKSVSFMDAVHLMELGEAGTAFFGGEWPAADTACPLPGCATPTRAALQHLINVHCNSNP